MYNSITKRNKNLLHMIKLVMDEAIIDTWIRNGSKGYNLWSGNLGDWDGIPMSIQFYIENTKLEIYEEDGWSIIGLPLKNIKFEVRFKSEEFDNNDAYWSRVLRYFFRDKISKGGVPISRYDDMNVFLLSSYGDSLFSIIDKANESKLEYSLYSGVYSDYKRRDIIPILNINFEKDKAFYILDNWAPTDKRSRITGKMSEGADLSVMARIAADRTSLPIHWIQFNGLDFMSNNLKGSIIRG